MSALRSLRVSSASVLLAFAALSGCAASPSSRPGAASVLPPAETVHASWVLRGGVVHRNSGPSASALAVRGTTILAVGSDQDVARFIGSDTRITELHGRSVVVALTDAHGHLALLGKLAVSADLGSCASPKDCAKLVGAQAAKRPEASWVLGRGWDQTRFADPRYPTHASLDAEVSDRPVWLTRIDGHVGWANAKALALAGIRRGARSPAGGQIVTDDEGEPTGIFVDSAMSLMEQAIPQPTDAERENAILTAQKIVLEHGLTETHEMGIDRATAAAFRRLERDGRLVLRVYAFASAGGLRVPVDETELSRLLASTPDVSSPDRRFTLRGIKMWTDGALGSRGAALDEPYADDPTNRGNVTTPFAVIESIARRARASGWQLAVHAIGDRANRAALDAFERAGCVRGDNLRFRVEHAQVIALAEIPRFYRLGVVASMQPTHATSDMRWARSRLGEGRLEGAYAWRRFIDANVVLALGSDFPVESSDPLRGLFAAETRTDERGSPAGGWLPDQRLTFAEALRGFTASPSYAAFEDGWRGDAVPGAVADITVFDSKLDQSSPAALLGARADLTAVGGRIVFER